MKKILKRITFILLPLTDFLITALSYGRKGWISTIEKLKNWFHLPLRQRYYEMTVGYWIQHPAQALSMDNGEKSFEVIMKCAGNNTTPYSKHNNDASTRPLYSKPGSRPRRTNRTIKAGMRNAWWTLWDHTLPLSKRSALKTIASRILSSQTQWYHQIWSPLFRKPRKFSELEILSVQYVIETLPGTSTYRRDLWDTKDCISRLPNPVPGLGILFIQTTRTIIVYVRKINYHQMVAMNNKFNKGKAHDFAVPKFH